MGHVPHSYLDYILLLNISTHSWTATDALGA